MRKLLAGAAAVFMLSSGAVGVMAAGPGSGCTMAGLHGNCPQSGVCDITEGHEEVTCGQNHEQNCTEDCMKNHDHDGTKECEEVHNHNGEAGCVNDHRQNRTSGTHHKEISESHHGNTSASRHRSTAGSHHLKQTGMSR